jgi:hypothetical protein
VIGSAAYPGHAGDITEFVRRNGAALVSQPTFPAAARWALSPITPVDPARSGAEGVAEVIDDRTDGTCLFAP